MTAQQTLDHQTNEHLRLLRGVSLFANLPDELLERVAQALAAQLWEPGCMICQEGQLNDRLYLLISGQVKVFLPRPEADVPLNYLGPGDYFGEMSLLQGQPASASVLTTLPTETLSLNRDQFLQVCRQQPEVYLDLCLGLSKRLRDANLRRVRGVETTVLAVNFWQPAAPGLDTFEIGPVLELVASALAGRQPQDVVVLSPVEVFSTETTSQAPPALAASLTQFFPGIPWRWRQTSCGPALLWPPMREPEYLDSGPMRTLIGLLESHFRTLIINEFSLDLVESAGQTPRDYPLFWFVPAGAFLSCEAGKTASIATVYAKAAQRKCLWEENPKRLRMHWCLMVKPGAPLPTWQQVCASTPGCRRILMSWPETRQEESGEVRLPRVSPSPVGSWRRVTPRILKPEQARTKLRREATGRRVGLVLGGGGARGIAHVGVIQVLEEQELPIDLIAGTSMGAVVGAGWAMGRSADELYEDMRFHWQNGDVFDFTFPRVALLKGRKVARRAQAAYGETAFDQLVLPLAVVATDLVMGEEVVIQDGPIDVAVKASGALPGVFRPSRAGAQYLVDGAVVNNLPVNVARAQGAHAVIVVDVTPRHDYFLIHPEQPQQSWLGKLLRRSAFLKMWLDEPSILRIITRSINLTSRRRLLLEDPQCVVITPEVERFDFFDFKRFDELVAAGRQAAEAALPAVRQMLSEHALE